METRRSINALTGRQAYELGNWLIKHRQSAWRTPRPALAAWASEALGFRTTVANVQTMLKAVKSFL
jgi:hypothetical protein